MIKQQKLIVPRSISVQKNVQCLLCHEQGHSETACKLKRNQKSQTDTYKEDRKAKAKIKKSESLIHKKETPLRMAPIIIKHISTSNDEMSNFEKTLIEIEETLHALSLDANSSNEFLKDYCFNLKKSVNQTSKEAIKQINNIKEIFIARIDNYERDTIKSNATNLVDENVHKSLENQLIQLTKYLKKTNNEENMIIANNAANKLKKRVDDQKIKLENSISRRRVLKFEKNENRISESILGKFTQEYTNKISCFLTNDQMKNLMNLCDFPPDQKWKLLYRATQDGFEASKFHLKCNQKSNTFIIIKSANGNIFGGYTEADWSGSGYKSDSNAFIFSFINLDKKPLKMKCKNPNNAIYCFPRCCATFGEKDSDIFICSNSNTIIGSHSNLGHSYSLPNSYKQAKSFLAGSFNFLISEIEVYTKE